MDDFKRSGGFPCLIHDFSGGTEAVTKEKSGGSFGCELKSDAIEVHASVGGFFDVAAKNRRGGLGRCGLVGGGKINFGGEGEIDLAKSHLRNGFFYTFHKGAIGIGKGGEEAL